MKTLQHFFPVYREVAHAQRILEEAFEAGGPAGHTLLWNPPVAARSWKTAIAVQAALAAASLQLDSTVVCKTRESNRKVRKLKCLMEVPPEGILLDHSGCPQTFFFYPFTFIKSVYVWSVEKASCSNVVRECYYIFQELIKDTIKTQVPLLIDIQKQACLWQ